MEIQLFNNPQFGDVRMSADENGNPLFLATDIAKALGYSNPRDAVARHCKSNGVVIRDVIDSMGRTQQARFISEGNLYRLISGSNLPESEKFESWIFDEVVPQIRKTGGYIHASAEDTPEEIMAKAVILANKTIEQQKQRIEALAQENAKKQLLIEEQKPKVLFADAVATAKQSCLIGELAKIICQNGVNIGQNRLFSWMRDNGYIGKSGQYYNLPTQKAMDMGILEIKKNTVVKPDGSVLVTSTTKVTGKGQQYFVNKFLGGR